MKVLHLSRTMGQGGAEQVVYNLASDSGVPAVVASSGGVLVKDLMRRGIRHYDIPDLASKKCSDMITTLSVLKRVVLDENVTIIHSHHRMAAFYAQLLAMVNKRISLVYTAHNAFYDKKTMTRFSLKNTRIVACGGDVEKNLVEFYGLSESRVEIIYNSVKLPDKIKKPSDAILLKPSGKKFIGFIGRLTEQKGTDVFLEVFKKVAGLHKDLIGFVVGDGELMDELIKMRDKLGLNGRVHFLGYRNDVFGIIKQLDFAVMPSRWEGFPLTPIECFAVGRTIVASDIDGMREIVIDDKNGLLAKMDSVDSFAEKVSKLLDDNEKLRALSNQAILDYNEKFSYNRFIESYRNIYCECR